MDDSLPELGDLEHEVMQLVWANGPVTAEAVRERLSRPLKESTVEPSSKGWKKRGTLGIRSMGGLMFITRPSHEDGSPRKQSSVSSTGSATAPLKKFWLAWWIRRCSISNSCERSPIRLRRPRQRVGGNNAVGSGGIGASLHHPRKRGVAQLEICWIRNPHAQMTCWLVVLLASFSMPLMMHWTTVSITVDALPTSTTENLSSRSNAVARAAVDLASVGFRRAPRDHLRMLRPSIG